jgi:hypothetical protein
MVLELIEKGEKALNIAFASKTEIKQTASGSLFIAQSLCYNLCIEDGIEETQHDATIINCRIEDGIRRTMDELETKFWEPTLRFVALGDYKDTTCLDLLRELADSEKGMLSLPELSIKKPEMEPGIKRFINESWMENLKKDYPRIREVLFYHSIGHVLVVEDPQLIFYLRRISFSQLAKAAGKIPQEAGQKPRLFICYSESEVLLLESLLLGLTPIRNQVTIDSWSDNDIPSSARDPRDLEIAIKSSTFALILVSQKFLITSGFITDYNLPTLLKKATNSTTILPIIAAPCLFEDSGLDQFQSFNDPNRSLAEMTDIERDRVFVQLADLIRKKLQKAQLP